MKNIHLIATPDPSRLIIQNGKKLILGKEEYSITKNRQHIYITSDEEIERDDYHVDLKNNQIYKADSEDVMSKDIKFCKKIILTTDQDLIAEGIQQIDDEFLEWFVKNPSCELIEIGKTNKLIDNYAEKDEDKWEVKYHIYIPKEELDYTALLKQVGTIQEQDNKLYSEELEKVNAIIKNIEGYPDMFQEGAKDFYRGQKELLEQFKKK